MSDKSAIEWTDATWNPVAGCSKVSPGCANCYAETLSLRFGYSAKPWTPANAADNVVLHPERLDLPLRWKRPRMVFVNSMSDLFHELVPTGYIAEVFTRMIQAEQHTFQVLTKRPERMRAVMGSIAADTAYYWREWPPQNVWLGTSIENNRWVGRADDLRSVPGDWVRFLSCEPLLGPLPDLNLDGIDWVIVGGESGAGARPMHSDWVRDLRDRCQASGTAFFFKQWGAWARGSDPRRGIEVLRIDGKHGPWTEWERAAHEFSGSPGLLRPEAIRRTGKGAAGRELDGRTWDEMPRMAVPA